MCNDAHEPMTMYISQQQQQCGWEREKERRKEKENTICATTTYYCYYCFTALLYCFRFFFLGPFLYVNIHVHCKMTASSKEKKDELIVHIQVSKRAFASTSSLKKSNYSLFRRAKIISFLVSVCIYAKLYIIYKATV